VVYDLASCGYARWRVRSHLAVNGEAWTALITVMPALGRTVLVDFGDLLMPRFRIEALKAPALLVLGAFALTGCVPTAYVQDYSDAYYSGGGYGYYSTMPPGYYGYPGYYPQYYYSPPVVYLGRDDDRKDRDHGGYGRERYGDRHDPGHDGHDGRADRDTHDHDRGAVGSPPHGAPPPGQGPASPRRDNVESRTPVHRGGEGHANAREVQP